MWKFMQNGDEAIAIILKLRILRDFFVPSQACCAKIINIYKIIDNFLNLSISTGQNYCSDANVNLKKCYNE